MSVVLNIPMPDRCCDCDLEYDCVACGITGTRHYRTGVDFDPSNQRHDDCPIIGELPQWVSVKDALPDAEGFYLVRVEAVYKPIRVFEYKPTGIIFPENQNLWKAEDGTRCFNWFVTHWMPIEPPKGDA